MNVCCPGWIFPTRTTDSHLKRIINTNFVCIWLYLLIMGLDTPETCSVWQNILRITCISSWFSFTRVNTSHFVTDGQRMTQVVICKITSLKCYRIVLLIYCLQFRIFMESRFYKICAVTMQLPCNSRQSFCF